jgi:PAS domain S-box-containing protein
VLLGEHRTLGSVAIERDSDLLLARQCARELAELLGFTDAARTRFSTALSEVVRRSLGSGGSLAEFRYVEAPAPALAVHLSYGRDTGLGPQSFSARSSSAVPRQVQAAVDGLGVAAVLVDAFDVVTDDERTTVTITMLLPTDRTALGDSELKAIRAMLARLPKADPLVELQRQNRELVDALERVGRAERLAACAARERQTLLALIPDVVWTAGAAGGCDYFSPRWRELTGQDDAMSAGDGWTAAVDDTDQARAREAYRAAIDRGEPFDLELRLRDSGGKSRWHRLRGVPLFEAGKVVRWFGTCTDIEDSKRREQEAARAAAYLKRIVSVVGHDLRAPLAVVMAAANVLEAKNDPATTARMVGRMKASVERAGRMIADLLDYTRVELGGGLALHMTRSDLGKALGNLLEHARLSHPNFSFALEVVGNTVTEVDEDRLVQAVGNLLENATIYGAADKPIALSIDGSGTDVRITVRNHGPTVAADLLPHVFEPFRRASANSSSRGLGLGLYIVSEVAKGHGGQATMSSCEQEGTTVEVIIPRRPGHPAL